VAEAAQADYESLREAVLAGTRPLGPAALRFEAAGLWGLLRRPWAEASYGARLFGAPRPAWSPYDDPRLEVLADAYLLVLGARGAVYARVSTEAQEARGTIGSQLEALREHVTAEGHQPAGEFVDDGYSGARLDRPGLDALRDAAEAGLVDVVLCLTPDRLSRSYAYQVLITDELARHGAAVRYLDSPDIASDPQARLLTQVQSVIAEYERYAEFGIALVMPSA
jgi:predicted site-specific integrase-resolvase